ncbi:10-formyltetrahydrofolate:L-methionyl-tRNA(fMet) N-formyltransferase [Gammaproteobacteria bacterium]
MPINPMKLLFAGTPEFAAVTLDALLRSHHSVAAVYTQPDRPAGRGQKLQFSPVKTLALAHHLPVLQPETLRNPEEQARFSSFGADALIVAAYGLILPSVVLNTPKLGCINVHASLLPRWRGAAPIQRALLAGDKVTGISIMQIALKLDSGAVWLRKTCQITPEDTAETLHNRLATLGAEALLEVLGGLGKETSHVPEPQDETQVTYAAKLEKSEAEIDWNQSTQEIDRKIRAFYPYPIAQTNTGATTVRIWQAFPEAGGEGNHPGVILHSSKSGIRVATGNGIIAIQRLQLPGRKPLTVAEILNSHAHLFPVGKVLGDLSSKTPKRG